ncbi:MAG TPA: response regulator [Pirellulaceae bacterium]|nr:response regulator [Pirellulaceae bacterium]
MFATGHPIRIAVLDDDPTLVRLIRKLLGYALGDSVQIETFESPEAFEDWLEINCCDLLLTDIEMPEMNGLEVLRLVKQRNAWTQVVMLTGASTSDRLIEALEYGAADYLVKPVQTAALNEVVMQSVQRIRRWRRAFAATQATS